MTLRLGWIGGKGGGGEGERRRSNRSHFHRSTAVAIILGDLSLGACHRPNGVRHCRRYHPATSQPILVKVVLRLISAWPLPIPRPVPASPTEDTLPPALATLLPRVLVVVHGPFPATLADLRALYATGVPLDACCVARPTAPLLRPPTLAATAPALVVPTAPGGRPPSSMAGTGVAQAPQPLPPPLQLRPDALYAAVVEALRRDQRYGGSSGAPEGTAALADAGAVAATTTQLQEGAFVQYLRRDLALFDVAVPVPPPRLLHRGTTPVPAGESGRDTATGEKAPTPAAPSPPLPVVAARMVYARAMEIVARLPLYRRWVEQAKVCTRRKDGPLLGIPLALVLAQRSVRPHVQWNPRLL